MLTQNILSTTSLSLSKEEILQDFRIACTSRQASLLGRKEVFMGKAKFGIFGDGKEVAQLAMAKVFQKGDFRSGYYRDQTFMFAIGELTYQQYFAQLYAHTDVLHEPATAGRMMNGHFGTRFLNEDGTWKNLTELKNSTSDISPTGGQMPRALGVAYASKLFRQNPELHKFTQFSNKGNEISFVTIGNASTSEGLFYETINAAGVLQVPLLISVWDDDYGISVPQKYHTTKESISKALAGFQRNEREQGIEIFVAKGWDYIELCYTYQKAEKICREQHIPVLVHVVEMTQPQGHSTSGSHERYKSKERLEWEREFDCIRQMKLWILENEIADEKTLEEIENEALETAKQARDAAWKAFNQPIQEQLQSALQLLNLASQQSQHTTELKEICQNLQKTINPIKSDCLRAVRKALVILRNEDLPAKKLLTNWLHKYLQKGREEYSSHLYSQSAENILQVPEIKPVYSENSKILDGREILQAYFDKLFAKNPLVFAIGEDVGKIGDVNQGFAGLQEKYGEIRITDTSIREATIVGQAIGAAMRGLRPIAEIQYLDYIYYAIQLLADDVSCLQYRTKGGQKVPLIIRTRGHRLEGIWHSGSPIGMLLNSLRGMRLLVPRNMTQAAGFYNTVIQSDEPALIIECLNGYRLKERLPDNIGEYTVPVGIPEVLREGTDITIVTYGSMCRIVMAAAEELAKVGIEAEVIDAQTLLPFDIHHSIVQSVKKTNRLLVADEDVEGGASAFILQQILEKQQAYRYLDSQPATLTAQDHRPAYGSDGDYFSKPNTEDVFEKVYEIMHEAEPVRFPKLF
ncbi:MAG: thiamine pyrophosphate-dependent enzyme [Microscillaceae bacterium]|nr:thiamine pyrophosphate-dependent enzyme [Microscillaceae bacterium]MDW8461340.1 thiamine pyrophosphate-dependent enzyme [Cytophagales bacterium]